MAAGKTTFAADIAEKMNLLFLDSDHEIEFSEGISITDIFKNKGEHYFRELESKFINNLSSEKAIISCGGGLACYSDLILKMKETGIVLFLDTDFDSILNRLKNSSDRPLVKEKTMEELQQLYNKRLLFYNLADIKIKNEEPINEIVLLLKSKFNL